MNKTDMLMQKADFYFKNKIHAHVVIIPTGFKNGIICSELIDNIFYWFFDDRDKEKKIRLFCSEIYDIRDYSAKSNKP